MAAQLQLKFIVVCGQLWEFDCASELKRAGPTPQERPESAGFTVVYRFTAID
jgi:hypothetical protein